MVGVQTVDVGPGRVAVVTLARPEQHNALNLAALEAASPSCSRGSHDDPACGP